MSKQPRVPLMVYGVAIFCAVWLLILGLLFG